MDDGGEIRGIWILQGACGDVCGYFVPHDVFEDAPHGGISGGDVQRGGGVLSRFGVCGGGEALGDCGAVAVGEWVANGVYGGGGGRGRQNKPKSGPGEPGPYKGYADWVDAGEGVAGGDDCGDCAGAGGGWGVLFAGGFSSAGAGGAG